MGRLLHLPARGRALGGERGGGEVVRGRVAHDPAHLALDLDGAI